MMTGNLDSQSFFPPGKVADYTGFQYLRDNDPDNMGHNTSFLTRVANNVIYILTDSQLAQLKSLAVAQLDQINRYGYKRFPLMKAFRRLLESDIPSGSSGLNLNAVKQASRELYILDGQISFDRAMLYVTIINSMDATQKAYLAAMKGKGWSSWPDITNDQIKSKMQGLAQGTAVAVMTYASDLYSWYAGSLDADVYFCPERQGTYYGSFYIKDAPAIGHEGYSIDEQLTATAGAALCDSSKGYVTASQAAVISSLVDTQRNNLYAGTYNIVSVRTQIATLLRSLLISTTLSADVYSKVLTLSRIYGELDGENNYHYATVFAQVYKTLTTNQKTKLAALRKDIMSGTYSDGTPFDYSLCSTPFLYSSVITDETVLAPYIADTDYLFFEPSLLYAYFTNYGLYKYDGTSWSYLHPTQPASMIAGTNLYAYFSGAGLWKHDGAAWGYLHPTQPASMTAGTNLFYAYFSSYGLYKHDGTAWTYLHPTQPASMTAGKNLYAYFSGAALCKYDDTSWSYLHPTQPASMTAGTNLYAYFTGSGLWKYDGSAWSYLHNVQPTSMVAGTNLYAYFSSYGLYKHNGTAWSYLHPSNPTSMTAGTNLDVYFSGYGLYKNDGAAWTYLHPTQPASMVGGN